MEDDSPKLRISAGHEDVLLRARITPHRSLGRTGLLLLFGGVIALTTLLSIPFYLVGAFPVVGFLGLDVLLLWVAFRVNNARARAYEELIVSSLRLVVRQVSWRGEARHWQFNPLWVRVQTQEHPEFGLQRVCLVEGRSQVELARHLGAEEKADFTGALKGALAAARRG